MGRAYNIPIIMYHSAGRIIHDWIWSYLTVPYAIFENHLAWLQKTGYRTCTLDELYDHVSGARPLLGKNVVLTFDDGYLDNWTYVTPLLKKYNFNATVFVNPDFVDPRSIVRSTLEDVWNGGIKEADLEVRGFCSWQELNLMSLSGCFQVQSHLMTHTWYPVSEEVEDFHYPGDNRYWMDWNAYPLEKPFYLINPAKSKVPYGTPVYKHSKSMMAERYYADENESLHLVNNVQKNGGLDFFMRKDWKDLLLSEVEGYRKNKGLKGFMENESQRYERLKSEIIDSKEIIEQKTGNKVNYLAWPGGGYTKKAMDLAKEVYKSVTLSSRDETVINNKPGGNPSLIRRVGVPNIEKKGKVFYPSGRYLIQFLDEYRGIRYARRKRQLIKMSYLISCNLRNS